MSAIAEGCRRRAPCGFRNAVFHAECLARLRAAQGPGNWRCPHCNAPVLDMATMQSARHAIGRMGQMAETWMAKSEPFWCERPHFVQVQQGLQHGVHEERVLKGIVAVLIEKMKRGCCVRVLSVDDDARQFSCISSGGLLVRLTLRRTAFFGKDGCILRDGYALSGCRCRVSPRRRL